eukprot:3397203-Pyramimonas_sp.AAC.1
MPGTSSVCATGPYGVLARPCISAAILRWRSSSRPPSSSSLSVPFLFSVCRMRATLAFEPRE